MGFLQMKKIIFTIVALCFIYAGLWYRGANQAKEIVEQKIAEATFYFETQGYQFKNEGVSVKGFPTNYVVDIKSPALKKNTSKPDLKHPLESMTVKGNLTLISNLLGTQFSVRNEGDTHIEMNQFSKEGKETQELVMTGKSLSSFSVEEKSYIESIKNPFRAIFKTIEENSENMAIGKNGSFHVENLKVIDIKNPSLTLFEISNGDVHYSFNETNHEVTSFKIDGDVKGLNMDTFLLGSDAFTPGPGKSLKEISLLLSMPKLGNTSLAFDLDVKAPFNKFQTLNENSTLAEFPAFTLDLKKFEISNDFGNYSHRAHIGLQDEKDAAKQFSFTNLGTSHTSPEQFQKFKSQFEEFLNNMPICEKNADPKAEVKTNDVCPLVKGLVPNLDQFGKITMNTELKFDMPNPRTPFENSTLSINHLDYFSELYGLKSNGVFDIKNPNMILSNYKIELLNYQSFFLDLVNYLKKVQQLIPLVTEGASKMPKISEKHLKLVTDYIKDLSDEPKKDQKDITITIKFNGSKDEIIGTLSKQEFLQRTQILISELAKDFQTAEKQKVEGAK